MSQFYFHRRCGKDNVNDTDGLEFTNLEAAQAEAMASARDILANAIMASQDDVPDGFVIADADGRELMIVSLRDALPKSLR